MVLTFNQLLRSAGLAVESTILLRHSDGRARDAIYKAGIEKDPRFDDYQRRQISPNVVAAFDKATYLASFVVDPAGATVFAGIWHILGRSDDSYLDPLVPPDPAEPPSTTFSTKRVEILDDFRGRLIIDWGKGFLAWCQRAATQTKPILEVRREISEPEFPGYLKFHHNLGDILTLPATWIAALKVCGGVYLLSHRSNGRLYVGSATGVDGFFGRWCTYQNGHGGNVGLLEVDGSPDDYDVAILEVAGSGLPEHGVLEMESCWKAKLGSRKHGLNRN